MSRVPREISRSPRLAHKAPVMQAKALHATYTPASCSPEKRGKIGLLFQYFSLFLSLSFTLLKRHHTVCLQAALSRTVPRAKMALLESLTVWHEDDYKLTEILLFASLVIKLRKEGWKQKCKWSIETSPNALQVRRNIHFFVTEFKILWKYPQQMKRKKEEAEEKRSSITIRISKLLRL